MTVETKGSMVEITDDAGNISLLSYDKLIAFYSVQDCTLYVDSNKYSQTTSKHLNRFLQKHGMNRMIYRNGLNFAFDFRSHNVI